MRLQELTDSIRPDIADALIATDFDGTLAPLELDPQQSQLAPGALSALTDLATRGAQVAVITGRNAATAVRLGGLDAVPGIVVVGLYGLETWRDAELSTAEEPAAIQALREQLPDAIRAGDPSIWVEDKRLSLVVHARRAQDPAAALDAVRESVTVVGTKLGLEVHPGSDVLELRLPGYDKASALALLAQDRATVLYLGDDKGDLPAFEQVRQLRASGVNARSVGVLSSQVDGIAEAVDATVADPPQAVELLQALGR